MFVKFHLSSNPKAKEEENHFTAFQKNVFLCYIQAVSELAIPS